MPGVEGVQYYDLFWETLEKHRGLPHYGLLRQKIEELITRKSESTDPMGGRDALFRGNQHLKGIWHFAASRNPDVVIFYRIEDSLLHLTMVGDHHDYPYNGKNATAAKRTAGRIEAAMDNGEQSRPNWDCVRWEDPSELIVHPELHELGAQALDRLMAELVHEMQTGRRFFDAHGVEIEETSEAEFERYVGDLEAAVGRVRDIRRNPDRSLDATASWLNFNKFMREERPVISAAP